VDILIKVVKGDHLNLGRCIRWGMEYRDRVVMEVMERSLGDRVLSVVDQCRVDRGLQDIIGNCLH